AGKYTQLKDAYKSIYEALRHAGIANDVRVNINCVDVERLDLDKQLSNAEGIIVAGGFGERGIEGKLKAVALALEKKIPFLGICLGMQCAIIEFSRIVCGLKNANSTEFAPKTKYPVIDLLPEQRKLKLRSGREGGMGGTMRLGAYPCKLKEDSIAFNAYKKWFDGKTLQEFLKSHVVYERHRHRYEFNNKFREKLTAAGLKISGIYEKENLVEIIELKDHPYFVGVQFHPEFKSRPNNPHPLFAELVKSAMNV
ncbi:MAG: CTP synthase, partial [Elusimicrobiota bacterium]|nr:CTP synthase [Elusimicrobiota bacterium]